MEEGNFPHQSMRYSDPWQALTFSSVLLTIYHTVNCKNDKEGQQRIKEEINFLKRKRLDELVIQGVRLNTIGSNNGTEVVLMLFRKELRRVGENESFWYSPEYNQKLEQDLVSRIDDLKRDSWRSRLSTWLGFGVETSGAVSVSSHPPQNHSATPNTTTTSSSSSSSNDSVDKDDDHSIEPALETEQPALPTEQVSDVPSDDSPQPAELFATTH